MLFTATPLGARRDEGEQQTPLELVNSPPCSRERERERERERIEAMGVQQKAWRNVNDHSIDKHNGLTRPDRLKTQKRNKRQREREADRQTETD